MGVRIPPSAQQKCSPSSKVLTVDELLDLYLDGIDADARLSPKTRFDYRN
ncbi:MAG: hypothetical protein LC808_14895 [Actinobacteria bacterium]|nr:hypothetical protein [Actinomycetota bacterium]